MNDEFLYRLRKKPPREFAVRLKAKLDRQFAAPRSALRTSLFRSVMVALLIGGTAFAVSTVSVRDLPSMVLSLFRAPESASSARDAENASEPAVARDSTTPEQRAPGNAARVRAPLESRSAATDRPAAGPNRTAATSSEPGRATAAVPAGTPSRGASQPRGRLGRIRIVGSADTQLYTEQVLSVFSRRELEAPEIEIHGRDEALMRFCDYGRGLEHPDIVVRFGRADPRLQACTRNGVEVVDLKVGYEAVVVARSKVYGALEMSARDVFLALAKEIPDPADPTTLIENPHDTWGEVNPALGYDRIEVVGPALDSATGKAFLALVLEAGCDTYPWIAGLEAVDRSRYLGICHAVRDDGAYQEMREGFEFMQRIETYPSVVGVFGYGSFERNDDKLAATILSGVAPTVANVAAGSYPASRTLHVHAKKENVQFIPGIWELVDDYLRSAELLGLVPPNSDERRAIHAKALDLKPSAP